MKAKTIFRVEKNADNPFVMVDRRVIENPKLSWKAKGLLAYLLSRPDNWVVRFQDLVNRAPDGAHTVRAALKELRKAGHVKVIKEYKDGRIDQWTYKVFESPILDGDFQQVENLQVENRTFNDTNVNDIELREIADALEQQTGGLNTNTLRYIDTWLEKHKKEWILKAIQIAKDNGARAIQYVDKILVGWEANGYPKSREEQVQAAKKKGQSKNTDISASSQQEYPEEYNEIAARIKASRAK